MNLNWYDDLCEYYKVTPEEALELGTRSSGRMPRLPGSATTAAVSDMTYEDIWELKSRKSQEEIFSFYKDQGAWSAFRQVVRHKDKIQFHKHILSVLRPHGSSICEYGCGIAPYTHTLLSNIDKNEKFHISISDVDCEHFNFGQWRLQKLIEQRELRNITLESRVINPNELPKYSKNLDSVIIFEVLEHVPSPIKAIRNIQSFMNPGALLCENFVGHDEDADDGPDLLSARRQRGFYYELLEREFQLRAGPAPENEPNATRIWQKAD